MKCEEIIKGLECINRKTLIRCMGCPYGEAYGFPDCYTQIAIDAIGLITRQKTEAIKEFAEKLKANITLNNTHDGCLDYSIDYVCLMEDIDDCVKDMTEKSK